jgi:pantothenate kinase
VLGLTGIPGAGKTTLAVALVERVNAELGGGAAVHLPMDGFHLANATLHRLGRHDRKDLGQGVLGCRRIWLSG